MGIFKREKDDNPINPDFSRSGTNPLKPGPDSLAPPRPADPSIAVYANASLARARALMGGPRMDNSGDRILKPPSLGKPSLLGA